MSKTTPTFLLINPWITDFAAYDFWSKPLGLLYLASVLRDAGASVDFIDCMNRFDPNLHALSSKNKQKIGKYGTGKYLRQIIPKPAVFSHVPRYYARYGLPLDIFRQKLCQSNKPDAVLVTSGMTYWYPGVQTAIREVRRIFDDVPVLLGGIYATLLPDHAQKHSGADLVVEGESESKIISTLRQVVPSLTLNELTYASLNDYPFPAWDFYRNLPYGIVMTSRGCPLRCSFCASYKVSGKYRWRETDSVVEEIELLTRRFGIEDIAFYDDALLTNHKRHLQPILQKVREKGISARFHTPNGLQCKFLDAELTKEMHASGFRTMRLSLESISEERQKNMSKKVNAESFSRAANAVHKAGFAIDDLDAYVMMALPGQPLKEVLQTMAFVHANRIGIRLACYSPIPGTVDYQRAIESGFCNFVQEPLLTNNSAIPIRAPGLPYETYNRVALLAKQLNQDLFRTGRSVEAETGLFKRMCAEFSPTELYATSENGEKEVSEMQVTN